MDLSGQKWKQLQEALIDAFPNKSSLERMLLFRLDKHLDAIAEGGSIEDIVFSLIKTAKARGWIVDLIRAAHDSNPGNSSLKTVADELLRTSFQDTDTLVQEIREQIKPYIKERCGTIRVLDMTQPIELDDIYTEVNILEKITGYRRLEIAELMENFNPEEFDRFGLGRITQERVPGLQAIEQHGKLMVLGKPGAGKTTFLKFLAIQCIEGQFQNDVCGKSLSHLRFPIFITLKDFAEAPKQLNFLEYIAQQLSICKVTDTSMKVKQLLEQGKVLVLLDGLDEVREEDTKRVLKQVQEFSYQFSRNQFVITCRIAAEEYRFQGFTEVEVADFNSKQIATFAQNWFRCQKDSVKSERFIEKLKENKSIQELATNPLLLTLLCLVFDEAGNFPANRSELYTEGVDVLLKKWDITRNIERGRLYKDLSIQRKQDLLGQIALTTFEQKNYFFKKKTVESYIVAFISNLYNSSTAKKELELDSEAVLKSIEAQHGLIVARARGIYSFSHLTFHEYFAAREIKERSAWESLVEHISENRWREVFLLTAGMLQNADNLVLLMKQKVDGLLAQDEKLQLFLKWLEKKPLSIERLCKSTAVRAHYFEITFALTLAPNLAYNNALAKVSHEGNLTLFLRGAFTLILANTLGVSKAEKRLHLDYELAYALVVAFALAITSVRSNALNRCLDLVLNDCFNVAFNQTEESELQQLLLQLKAQIPSHENNERYEAWWKANGKTWTQQLRAVMIEHRNIGYDWQFSNEQIELLQQYYDANKLLVDCLKSDCCVSREVRQQIEDTLLLPNNTTGDRISNG